MKQCTYCGKEYPDEATACAVDGKPLAREGQPVGEDYLRVATAQKQGDPAPAVRPVKPALMTRLRSLHLYLGCIFAPMLLFFALSGIWQTLGIHGPLLSTLSSIHTMGKMKNGTTLTSPMMRCFVLAMAIAFITTTILGIVMAVKYGRSRRAAYYCLAAGVAVPMLLIVIHLIA